MSTAIHKMVDSCRDGSFARLICKMPSGWLILGEKQVVSGYCLLLPDPVVPHLNALQGDHRQKFLNDMVVCGDAILKVTKALRINYEMLGNLEPALHCHLFPRYDSEPEELKTRPIWFYDWDSVPSVDIKTQSVLVETLKQILS
ncbi:MAG: hypothetical protein H3C47_16630 [Candidatus Cloacimonetes bacterium]|nr:hypothetical protein [Candidatus Cloacimonadota bacterium]